MKRLIIGKNLEQSVKEIRGLNEKGLVVTLGHLGEFILDEKEVLKRTDEVNDKEKLDTGISHKLTSLGLIYP